MVIVKVSLIANEKSLKLMHIAVKYRCPSNSRSREISLKDCTNRNSANYVCITFAQHCMVIVRKLVGL